MKSPRLARGRRGSNATLRPGDVTWVKTRRLSWWPAQVVAENSVSKSLRPRKILKRAVLLRLYGSYKYIYHVDPIKSTMEFKNILEQQKCSCEDMLKKAIEHVTMDSSEESDNNSDIGDEIKQESPKKSRKKVGRVSLPSEEPKKRPKCKIELNDAPKKAESDIPVNVTGPTILEKTPEMSARRLKVMQSLGLIAPEGSPFYKNRYIQPVA